MRLALDWDGTCIENRWPSRKGKWLPDAQASIHQLLDAGWYVTIHTSRIAPLLPSGRPRRASAVTREVDTIRKRLDDAGLSSVGIHTDPWKPPADVYLDDHGMLFTSWKEAMDGLLGQ